MRLFNLAHIPIMSKEYSTFHSKLLTGVVDPRGKYGFEQKNKESRCMMTKLENKNSDNREEENYITL